MVTYDTLSIIQPLPLFSLTNEEARVEANTTLVRRDVCLFFSFSLSLSTGRASVTWNYLAAEITRDEREQGRKSSRAVGRACQLDGKGRKSSAAEGLKAATLPTQARSSSAQCGGVYVSAPWCVLPGRDVQ